MFQFFTYTYVHIYVCKDSYIPFFLPIKKKDLPLFLKCLFLGICEFSAAAGLERISLIFQLTLSTMMLVFTVLPKSTAKSSCGLLFVSSKVVLTGFLFIKEFIPRNLGTVTSHNVSSEIKLWKITTIGVVKCWVKRRKEKNMEVNKYT